MHCPFFALNDTKCSHPRVLPDSIMIPLHFAGRLREMALTLLVLANLCLTPGAVGGTHDSEGGLRSLAAGPLVFLAGNPDGKADEPQACTFDWSDSLVIDYSIRLAKPVPASPCHGPRLASYPLNPQAPPARS